MIPLPAELALDRYFLEARSKLLEVAAILDRVGRGEGSASVETDPRWQKLHQALAALQDRHTNRAEHIQQIFSQEYDAKWKRPRPG
jgi:hypothetical protein